MPNKTYSNLLRERLAAMAFNMGLKSAIYILESAENLSPEGCKYLTDALKNQIAGSEVAYTVELIRGMA